jgi:hypothetical protein
MERKGTKRGPYTKKANPEERNAAKKKAAPAWRRVHNLLYPVQDREDLPRAEKPKVAGPPLTISDL